MELHQHYHKQTCQYLNHTLQSSHLLFSIACLKGVACLVVQCWDSWHGLTSFQDSLSSFIPTKFLSQGSDLPFCSFVTNWRLSICHVACLGGAAGADDGCAVRLPEGAGTAGVAAGRGALLPRARNGAAAAVLERDCRLHRPLGAGLC